MTEDAKLRGARALRDAAGVRRLPDQLLRVSGDDARSWLNGQITNDVASLEPEGARYALVVNLKGRVVTDLYVLDRGEALDLVLPPGRRDSVSEYLDGFIIMEDVELAAVDDVAVLSVQGPRAPEVVAKAGVPGPAWPCRRLGTEGRDCVVPFADAEGTLAALVAAAESVGGGAISEDAWEMARIRAGVPTLGRDFGDDTYPQEAGLKARAVAFGKGCYQGQEAVVMLEHRGKPPKKLVQLHVEGASMQGASIADAGTPLSTAEGRTVGHITSAVQDPEAGGCVALGYLKRDHAIEDARYTAAGRSATVRQVLGG